MDASHLADLHVQRMGLWLLNVDSEMAIFRGALKPPAGEAQCIGLAVGVFDLLHHGHMAFLRAARLRCDYLIVGLQFDPSFSKQVQVQHSYRQRLRRLALLRAIDRIIPYQTVEDLVEMLYFNRLFLGEDQLHQGFAGALAHCRGLAIPVLRLPRTPGISSSGLRQGQFGRFRVAAAPPRH